MPVVARGEYHIFALLTQSAFSQIIETRISASGNWHIYTPSDSSSVGTSEIANIGASGSKVFEAVFVFDLSGYDNSTFLHATLMIYGGTTLNRPLQGNVDFFGLPNFSSPPTVSDSRFGDNGDSAIMILPSVFTNPNIYTERWYELPNVDSFIRAQLQAGNHQIDVTQLFGSEG